MTTARAALIGDTAITILAERGMRGLTHRAVDESADLPSGSTSNLARTRAALLELALARLAELEEAQLAAQIHRAAPPGPDLLAGLADVMAESVHQAITVDRNHAIARYELALEATRRPELRKVYDEIGRRFRDPAIALLTAAGSSDPVRHGRQVVAFGEGMLFDAVVGAGTTPSLSDLKAAFAEFLNGILSH
ncbi:TetR/AcrR family transcriptional regulator [Acrocarpospora sp. B8E8]|uniref:TetR/AcrR family transcriptional regulator n=1 Tax=Acrocarpospora sp. B8E8 TaxID=3153572 RepID=UPI00325F9468